MANYNIKCIKGLDGSTYYLKDASALASVSINDHTLSFYRRNNTSFSVILPDSLVKQHISSTNALFPILTSSTSSPGDGGAYEAIFSDCFTYNQYHHSIINGNNHGDDNFIEAIGDYSYAFGTSGGGNIMSKELTSIAGGNVEKGEIKANGPCSIAYGSLTNDTGSHIYADAIGTIAYGYIDGNNSQIHALGDALGAHINGCILSSQSYINTKGAGSIVHGCINNLDSHIYTTEDASGAYIGGCISSIKSYIEANGPGTIAHGFIAEDADNSLIIASGNGARAYGYIRHECENGSIIASGMGSIASGHIYDKNNSIWADGDGAHAEGIAEGEDCLKATGRGSFALGINTQATAEASFALGASVVSNLATMMAIGKFNSSSTSAGDLFAIGYGSVNSRKTVFNVHGLTPGSNATCTVTVTGAVNAVNGFFQTSDKRQKNIVSDLPLNKVYDLIDKCQTIIYTLKDDETNKEQIGMIAQEIQEFFPEVISEDKNGLLSLDYSRLTVIIFKVLKDLIKRIEKLEKQNV